MSEYGLKLKGSPTFELNDNNMFNSSVDYSINTPNPAAVIADSHLTNKLRTPTAEQYGKGFDWRGGAKLGFQGLQTLGGLANAYTAYKQMQNAEDQLSLQEEFANKNYDATRKTMNNEIARRARVDAAFRGLAGADAEAFEQDTLKKQGI